MCRMTVDRHHQQMLRNLADLERQHGLQFVQKLFDEEAGSVARNDLPCSQWAKETSEWVNYWIKQGRAGSRG